jgi:nucleoid DNA-binding protein
MDELIKQVEERTGLSEAQAKEAAQAVLDILEHKLPDPCSDTIKITVGSNGSDEEIRSLGLFSFP